MKGMSQGTPHSSSSSCLLAGQPPCEAGSETLPHQASCSALANLRSFLLVLIPAKFTP